MFKRVYLTIRTEKIPVTCSLLGRTRWFSSKKDFVPDQMQRWSLHRYGADALVLNTVDTPLIKSPSDILVKVHAASVNPIDLRIRNGYGVKLLNLWRKLKGTQEFPLILGRDFSGVVVKTGRRVRRFKPGDEVWGTPSVPNGGTHTQYLIAQQDEISMKPSCLSHVEAASLPYVACTVWVGLKSRAGLNETNCPGKRVLVYGGSGGIGTFAIQLLKAWGADVTTTCRTDAVELVMSLGADHVIDYNMTDVEAELEGSEGFDVILDPFGGKFEQMSTKLLSQCTGSVYVNLAPPLLPNTDRLGLGLGIVSSGQSFLSSFAQKAFFKGGSTAWAFFVPNPGALDHVARLTETGQIRPVIQSLFPFNEVPEAFAQLEAGHSRGKTVIQVAENGETCL
ncbi:reticulon-4-interacting protein 1, mitochondrial-like [Actinia tenebrosa]|uniref:Reticulon-4-interacting protein 1, mitochondrial-like n=1 Tax=Actinia tenebrosa TaxID=6105 RepID=A0A6P8IV50_ACTTE|nr:reticulon-4-interacting protein 1, mitochondrial-like [Actinia tenebrosa]